jgi:hypothetical protein
MNGLMIQKGSDKLRVALKPGQFKIQVKADLKIRQLDDEVIFTVK